MCGIAGYISKNGQSVPPGFIDNIQRSLRHRGPDHFGLHREELRAFINLRLAIIDLALGNQPFYSDDRTAGIVYNGEVYNYQILRRELLEKGYAFQTNSDTEVVLKMYLEFGTEGFRRLEGMFSFCIWDDKKSRVYLARDSFGIKPIYLYEDENKYIFSSELKGILCQDDIQTGLDVSGLEDYFVFRYVQTPFTIFKRIRKVAPGSYLEFTPLGCVEIPFWDVSYAMSVNKPLDNYKIDLDRLVQRAVKDHLISEVPVGVLLSGGIDSSVLAYYVYKNGYNLKTFNIGFPEVNEFEYSRTVAKKFELEHIEILTSVNEIVDRFEEVNYALDEPIADPACLPLYILCEEVKKHVTVVLSGEGGDEIFGGYPQYVHMLQRESLRDNFSEFLKASWYFESSISQFFLPHVRHAANYLRNRKYFDEGSRLNRLLAFDLKTWIPDNLMMKADKILMAHSLEGRFPFLDRSLFQYMASVPESIKINQGVSKWILKELSMDFLPKIVISRPKMGFTVPIDLILKKMKEQVIEVFQQASTCELREYIDFCKINKMVQRYFNEERDIPHLLVWSQFILFYWLLESSRRYRATSF